MINSADYIKNVNDYFEFLITEFEFKLFEKKVRGNVFYDMQYKNNTRVVSISYENLEDYLLIVIFMLQNGEMPDYDDKTKTLHLKQLNKLVIAKTNREEIKMNAEYFIKYSAKSEFEKKILKEAKELRLCLKHFPK